MTRPNDVQAAFTDVLRFLGEWKTFSMKGDDIYGLHMGMEERECVLTCSKLASLLDYIESLEKAAEWRTDWENAPRDRDFMVYIDDDGIHGGIQKAKRVGKRDTMIIAGMFSYDLKAPTHWHPLPTPPDAK